jgi:PAS domain S-box-containing protein
MDDGASPRAAGLSDRLRLALLDNPADGVYFVDRQRRITYWNAGAERLTGFSADEVVGRRCRDGILNHCDAAGTALCGAHCPLLGTMLDGKVREIRAFLHHKDGYRRPVCVRAAPLCDEDDHIIGAVEIFHDDGPLLAVHRRVAALERAVWTDALTGIGNRLFGEMVLAGWTCAELPIRSAVWTLGDRYRRFQIRQRHIWARTRR